ncbi:hypothetical protein GCM10010510_20300 [Streptomyces anandii JCM 4720]|nr:hypothetical protein GCM10010510_20300 [Streptomyces anandii JCM 4720]
MGAALLDQQPDARIAVVEGTQHVGQQAGAHARRGAQPHPAPPQLHQLLHLVPSGVRVGEDAPGQRQQRLARGGERDVAPGPQEQIRAQFPLQRLDLLRQRRLGDMDHVRGPGEVPRLGHRHEVLELLELHPTSIAPPY